MKPTALPNTFARGRKFYVKNSTPGETFFQERTFREHDAEYRELDPKHSKLAAALVKSVKRFGITAESAVLYLGASHGYTPSFVSDMARVVYCVELSPVVAKDLVFLAEARRNVVPILADASTPESYSDRITPVDVVFQDIAQRDQVQIFLRNVERHLKPGGWGLLALKARSVDATAPPKRIFRQVDGQLADAGLEVLDGIELAPFEKDHAFFVVRRSQRL